MVSKEAIIRAYYKYGSIIATAEYCGCSATKVKKILIDKGLISSPLTEKILFLLNCGKSKNEIMQELNISSSSYNVHLPYSRTPYNIDNCTKTAKRIRKWRESKKTNN